MQNGFVESFNGRLLDECLNDTVFTSMAHARFGLAARQHDYNTVRPYSNRAARPPLRLLTNGCGSMPPDSRQSHQTTNMDDQESISHWQLAGPRVSRAYQVRSSARLEARMRNIAAAFNAHHKAADSPLSAQLQSDSK